MYNIYTMAFVIAADAPNGRHIPGDPREVYWGTAAFLVVMGLFFWKGLPAVKDGLAGRTERIRAELDAAKAERAEAEAALTSTVAEQPDLSSEEARIRAEATETAAKLKSDMIARAQVEADGIRERGTAEVSGMRRQAQADLAAEVAEATRRATEDVVREGLDPAAQTDLIESYINRVSEMS